MTNETISISIDAGLLTRLCNAYQRRDAPLPRGMFFWTLAVSSWQPTVTWPSLGVVTTHSKRRTFGHRMTRTNGTLPVLSCRLRPSRKPRPLDGRKAFTTSWNATRNGLSMVDPRCGNARFFAPVDGAFPEWTRIVPGA